LATDDHADVFYTDPTNDGTTSTAVRVREHLIWESLIWETQIPDEVPETPTAWAAADFVTEIYYAHYHSLVRLAVLLVHDVETADEVVQDAFEAMHLASGRLRDSKRALQYLRQTVVNKSRLVLRHRKVVDMHAPKAAPDEPSAEHAALAILEHSAVAAALGSLPERQREAIALRYYSDFSEAEIADAMEVSRLEVKTYTASAMATLKSILEGGNEANKPSADSLPVSIYVAEEDIHAQVEATVEEWLAKADISIEEREQPIIGSWFRRMRATAKAALNSETAQDVAMTAVHAADTRLVLAQDAHITATLLSNLAPVIASLQPTKDAVLRVGALLIVKVDWVVRVVQLTAAQQAILDHQPHLASAPHEIIAALQLPSPAPQHATSAADLGRP
jgi:RNA polymerase sigma-70 factor (sigma-E family)